MISWRTNWISTVTPMISVANQELYVYSSGVPPSKGNPRIFPKELPANSTTVHFISIQNPFHNLYHLLWSHLHQVHRLHLPHLKQSKIDSFCITITYIIYINSVFRSSTFTSLLQTACVHAICTGVFTRELWHSCSDTGVFFAGVITQELTSRNSTCIWKLWQNSYFKRAAKTRIAKCEPLPPSVRIGLANLSMKRQCWALRRAKWGSNVKKLV